MSVARDFRQELKDSIVAAGILTAQQVVIERQTDIFADIDTAVAQDGGLALTISGMEGKQVDGDSPRLIFDTTLLLSLWAVVEWEDGMLQEEAVHQELMLHVHHLVLPSFPVIGLKRKGRLEVLRWTDTPDKDYLRKDIVVASRIYYS